MTPKQFKALGLKQGDIARVTLDMRVDLLEDAATDARPFRGISKSGLVYWPNVGDIRALEIVEATEAPLAVGDRIWHKRGKSGESRELQAIVDVGGVPHVVCFGWVSGDQLICAPLADYVRAKA